MVFVKQNRRNYISVSILTMSSLFFIPTCLKLYWETNNILHIYSNITGSCGDDFQVIEKDIAFAYSAYIDGRPARDTGPSAKAVIRVFGYITRTIDVKQTWQCLLWYSSKLKPVITPVIRVTNANELASPRFMPAMILCGLPEDPDYQRPHAVSVVPKSASTPLNFICVKDLRRSSSETLQPSVNFTVCTSPIHGNFYKPHEIVNFIEVNRILGAQKFIFYSDINTDYLLKFCLESYVERGIVEIYNFTPPAVGDIYYHGQILAITECIYRTMYRTKYLINIDLDEIIVPKNDSSWAQLIESVQTKINKTKNIAAYIFQNQFFPLQAKIEENFENSTLVRKYAIVSLLQTLKENHIFPHESRSKVMAAPERLLIWHVHLILKENLISREDIIHNVDKEDGLLFHYRKYGESNNLVRDRRMHHFASQITENVHFGMGHCIPVF